MTNLYLVRHGETYDNARQILQGQVQGELNTTGISQAEQVRDALAHVAVDAVVASDLWRSIQTARIVAAPHGLEVTTTPLLRERDWGDFTGRYIPDLSSVKDWPDNVEPLPQLLDRARRFLEFLRTTFPGQTVVAVGHGIVNKAIQAVLLGKQMNEVERMKNAEVRVFDV